MGSKKPFGRVAQPSYKKGTQSRFEAKVDLTEGAMLLDKLEEMPVRICRDVRDVYLDRAAKLIASAFRDVMPELKHEDRVRWSPLHRDTRKFGSFPRTKSTIEYVIRRYGKFSFTAFVGPTYPHGAKSYFDYYGKTNRMESFWATDKNNPKKYRARQKTKRNLSQEVQDATQNAVKRILEEGIDKSIVHHMQEGK